ncbi:MAG: outer membrane beta-barrel protein [Gammaproteobacteria bacterium]|nr:outer membrane beta-barrel protein [Gammaproteobacteria bacterium]
MAISYISGANDVTDLYSENIESEVAGADVSALTIPIGTSLHPYYEFHSGFGVGAGIGPATVLYAKSSSGSRDYDYLNIPVNVDIRYSFAKKGFAPYLRAGVRKNNASGDYVIGDNAGMFYGIGAEFRTSSRVHLGVEVAQDNSEIAFIVVDQSGNRSGSKKIKPTGLMVSFYMIF